MARKLRIAVSVFFGVVTAALVVLLSISAVGCQDAASADRVIVLKQLRDEVNSLYGYGENGTPRINCGPCARFAILFREQWNARFQDKVNIACIMFDNGLESGHVVVKFTDGTYFDGGNGVQSEQQLHAMFDNRAIEEMAKFDLTQLNRRVGGLDRDHYPLCPNYSDEWTARVIEKHLARLAPRIDEKHP